MTDRKYTIQEIADILNITDFKAIEDTSITSLLIDSRTANHPETSLFFALHAQRDGHDFIGDAYDNGVRNFVVSKNIQGNLYPGANFLLVPDVVAALQLLATNHRQRFRLPVIAITGSNGKTVVKEWLNQLLVTEYDIVRSPKSFNSQIGVPLSVWQIRKNHTLGIFEAGISKFGEMELLGKIIRPSIGILTNIGEAHDEGFDSHAQKLSEKLQLFEQVDLLIYSPDYIGSLTGEDLPGKQHFSWSTTRSADLRIIYKKQHQGKTYVQAEYQDNIIECLIPFTDGASVENAIICWATLLAMGYDDIDADLRLERLSPVQMRLTLKHGINQCSVIDDSYSADESSLAIALDFLHQQKQHINRTIILSDLYETGKADIILYTEIVSLLAQNQVSRVIGIGPHISSFSALFPPHSVFFSNTQEFLDNFPELHFNNETILVKGARRFEFERISKLLTQKNHDTVLEIDLKALGHNLKFYQSQLKPGVKVMAMVKAFSYGSGSYEIANLLQFEKVDYLAVAYADEGIALRRAGITMPIMVMSPEPSAFEAMQQFNLEPELYSVEILRDFVESLPGTTLDYPVHLKIDTGMHRLGIEESDLPAVFTVFHENWKIKLVSAFSHLAASEDPQHDDFTKQQISTYLSIAEQLKNYLGYGFIRHIANTAAITRHPDAQMDMVRIGIGLYGFDAGMANHNELKTVGTLKTTITQIKSVKASETIGYGRRGALSKEGKIATVKIGYADGYRRAFGNGVGRMLVNGKEAPTVGSIAMDMCMIDITGIEATTGDEVIVFNDQLTIVDLAAQIDTIPYEILTNISQRVRRVYFYE